MCLLCLKNKIVMMEYCANAQPPSRHVDGFGECSYRAGCLPGLPRQPAAFKEELGMLVTGVGGLGSQSDSSGGGGGVGEDGREVGMRNVFENTWD